MKRVALLSLLLLVGCSSRPSDLRGVWGGEGAELTISETFASFIENCGDGEIPGMFVVDASGNFKLSGTFDSGFCDGNPKVPCEPGAQPVAAQYSGHISGTTLSLTMTTVNRTQPSSYTLTYGRTGDIVYCP